ncbi:hypothetical protein NC651_004252 [Populus alba x Populus x berolinensis]|nr:hypothetical protein NC651_004252 [Populus alba x Populus x berolinensis]
MSEANQGNNPDASATVHLKRRRGRSRKYPKMEVDHEVNAHVPGIQNLNHGENAHAPLGFEVVNSNQTHQVGPVNNAIDAMIGQSVYGVIEATFDAGYLLNVRVEGMRFPGPRGRNGRRGRNAHADRAANPPVNLSNGALSASATNQTAHLVPSKGKQVLDAAHSSNGLTPTNEIIQFQSQNNHQVITSPFNQNPAGGLHESEASPMKTTHMPFEKLLTEVIRRVHAPSQSTETNSSLAVNFPVEDPVASIPSEDYKTGKMTQLLQTEEPAAGSGLN